MEDRIITLEKKIALLEELVKDQAKNIKEIVKAADEFFNSLARAN